MPLPSAHGHPALRGTCTSMCGVRELLERPVRKVAGAGGVGAGLGYLAQGIGREADLVDVAGGERGGVADLASS